ncbi:MAG: hypothetical protein D6788_04290, partial [Planctomycetota bacterium]
QDGGAIFNRESRVRVVRCVFERNSAWVGGGAVASEISDLTVENSRLERNRAHLQGGGIFDVVGRLTIERSVFDGNEGADSGGGVYTFGSDGVIRNSLFVGNHLFGLDPVQGGALDIQLESDITIDHCTFSGNDAPVGASLAVGDPHFPDSPSRVTVTNAILADGGRETPHVVSLDDSTVTIRYSSVRGGFPGAGNLDAFARFWTFGSNFHLLPGSPGINAGDPNFVPQTGERDLDGNPRLQGCRTDMGAYESPIQQVVGDFNGDRWIDLRDVAAFQRCMGAEAGSSAFSDACVCGFDADADGRIGLADFADLPARQGNARRPPPRIDRLVPSPGEWIVDDVGLEEIRIGFSEEVLVPFDAIDVWTVGGGTVSDFTTAYDAQSNILTVRFAAPLRDDRVTLVVDYVITGLTGTELDGEIYDPLHAALPSGDGWPGGQGVFRIHVLEGDANRDGVVDAADEALVSASLGLCAGDAAFDARADLNGDGCVDATDAGIATAALGRQLPATDGVPPVVVGIREPTTNQGAFDTVVIDFSEPIILSLLNKRTCFLVDRGGTVLVPASVGAPPFGTSAVYTFTSSIHQCDNYTINISNAIAGSTGELLTVPGIFMCP